MFATADTTRGRLSKGISYATTVDGADGSDLFNVYSNKGDLHLLGGDGNDTFVLRAFVEAGSLVMSGEAGTDNFQVEDFDYVHNEHVTIDGGAGSDTVVLVGTELDDGFLVSADGLSICKISATTHRPDPTNCAVNADYSNIESVQGQGLEGDDVFQVLSTSSSVATALFGSQNSDTFIIGNNGDVTGIDGPVRINGEADPEFDASIAPPVVLPGENSAGADDPAVTSGTNVGDTLLVDASNDASGNTGAMTDTAVTGLGMQTGRHGRRHPYPSGVQFANIEFANVQLDSQADTFTVTSTHEVDHDAAVVRTHILGGGGNDTFNVQSIADTTRVSGEAGDDTINVGSLMPTTGGTVHGIDAKLDVVGGDGTNDRVFVDDSGDPTDNTLTSVQNKLTGLGLSSEGITYGTVELLDVSNGAGNDVANIKGTSTNTVLHGNDGNDRYYVADTAALTPGTTTDHLVGTLDDIDGNLTIDAGAGHHTLMVSDDAATAGDGTTSARAVLDHDSITGLSTGPSTTTAPATSAAASRCGRARAPTHCASPARARRRRAHDHHRQHEPRQRRRRRRSRRRHRRVHQRQPRGGRRHVRRLRPLAAADRVRRHGADTITTGSGTDTVLGDVGRSPTRNADGTDVTVLGNGGPGDKTDGVARPIATITPVGTTGSGDRSTAVRATTG